MRTLNSDVEREQHALREKIYDALEKRLTLPRTRFFHIDKDADISEFWGFLMGHVMHTTVVVPNKLIMFQTWGESILTGDKHLNPIMFTPTILIRYGDARTNKRIPLEIIFDNGDTDISIELTSVLMNGWFPDRWCEMCPDDENELKSIIEFGYLPHSTWTRYAAADEPDHLKQLLMDLCAQKEFDKQISFVETKGGYPTSFKYQFV